MIKTSALIKQLNKSAKNLSLENKKIFDDMVLYIRTSNLKARDAEEFLQQILDSFLNAEHQGVSIEYMLGTSDIKNYCKEIVITYKSSYNYISRCSEYIMYAGMFIAIISFITMITQNFTAFIINGTKNLSFYLNVDLELISQFLILVPIIIILMTYFRNSCFKENTKRDKVKAFFIEWIFWIIVICIMVVFSMFVDNILFFRLNIGIVLIIGIILYFIGNYASER
ncbi:hypothetical protein KTC96_06250 [Clostridium estertheticum]|uniref:hypothetical protein n=1 Tax=Clostridium estertheticum TaxID=238834 RepID=UPI001C7E15D7|nr:hypothetical protein [Clostridium estertheticum]MBX4262610.1 hypothetical protein [Clostridium estertheticum]WLC71606.1 hypothetical protein KTC96_06250 [Clostridium estertheticum]